MKKVRRKNGGENVRQKMAGNARGCRKKFYVGRKTPVTKENYQPNLRKKMSKHEFSNY